MLGAYTVPSSSASGFGPQSPSPPGGGSARSNLMPPLSLGSPSPGSPSPGSPSPSPGSPSPGSPTPSPPVSIGLVEMLLALADVSAMPSSAPHASIQTQES